MPWGVLHVPLYDGCADVNSIPDSILTGTLLRRLQELEDRAETIRDLLATALKLCVELGNCPELQEEILEMVRLYEGPRYETVTLEELQSIKAAMVSGRGGIVTHSGHWYNCANGHPFAIGECCMPMEQARCRECGAPIGGQNHTVVEGVTRAREME